MSLLLVALLGAPIAGPAATTTSRFEARAYCLETDRLLYVERHTEELAAGRPLRGEVAYLDPDNELFAVKELDYRSGPAAPSFEMVDRRDGFREGARVGDDAITLFAGHGEIDSREIRRLPQTAVVDAGFHRFVQQNLEALAAGERVEFDFAVPAEGRFFRFEVALLGEEGYRGDSALRLRMRPSSRLLRLLVDPIELVYDRQGRLREFIGLTNVPGDNGKRQSARIVFDYGIPATTGSGAPTAAVATSR